MKFTKTTTGSYEAKIGTDMESTAMVQSKGKEWTAIFISCDLPKNMIDTDCSVSHTRKGFKTKRAAIEYLNNNKAWAY